MKNQIVKLQAPELDVLEKSKSEQIKSTFMPMAEMLKGFEDQYDSLIKESEKEITQDVTAKAKRLRLDIAKVRIETGKLKDKQKEYIKLEDRAIMGVHNILVYAVKEKEDRLKEIENYFEMKEQERLLELQRTRVEELSKYVEDAQDRNLSYMDDEVWNAYLNAKKKDHEDRIAAEKKAEQERIAREKAEAEERERIRKENEQLKKEAEERERLAKIEQQKREAEEQKRREKEEAERKAREEKERKEREAHEAQLKAERERAEKAQRELEAKKEAERKAKEAEERRVQAELSKGDAAKVKDLVSDLEDLQTKYEFKSARNKSKYEKVCALIGEAINVVNPQ